MGWGRKTLLEMRGPHYSRPPDLSAAAAPDAPDEEKQIVKHPIYGL